MDTIVSFNPSTGLMLISTLRTPKLTDRIFEFQSLDWVDVDFDACESLRTLTAFI